MGPAEEEQEKAAAEITAAPGAAGHDFPRQYILIPRPDSQSFLRAAASKINLSQQSLSYVL